LNPPRGKPRGIFTVRILNRFSVRSLTPPQAAGNALAIAVQTESHFSDRRRINFFSFFLKVFSGPADMVIGGTHMYIQSYQIHNVLNVYRRQLSQGRVDRPQHVDNQDAKSDPIAISTEGKNQSIMEKVAAGVLKKITNVDPGSDFGQEMIKQVQDKQKDLHMNQKDTAFIFNTIVGDNQKETRSIAVDNSQGLMNRLDELAKAAINRKAE
jgi:hypothetical protein